MQPYQVIAFDLDGTLTQHKSPLSAEGRLLLDRLSAHYTLLMAGAGDVLRIFDQMGRYPLDIIGNYGMQFGKWEEAAGLTILRDERVPCDRTAVLETARQLRQKFGWAEFWGDSLEFHPSGCLTFPILGTAAPLEEKLRYDPGREKRRAVYRAVCEAFGDYQVFIGGSSSFDLVPRPYNKYQALAAYADARGCRHAEILFVGDDWGPGGNDEPVYRSDFPFIPIEDYRTTAERLDFLLRP